MNTELLEALNILEKEKDISKETLLDAIENSLMNACKNHFGKTDNIKLIMNKETCEYQLYAEKTVVEEVEDKLEQISLEDADINTPEGYAVIKEAYKGYVRRYYSGIKITDRDIRNWWDLRKEGYDFIPTGEE